MKTGVSSVKLKLINLTMSMLEQFAIYLLVYFMVTRNLDRIVGTDKMIVKVLLFPLYIPKIFLGEEKATVSIKRVFIVGIWLLSVLLIISYIILVSKILGE